MKKSTFLIIGIVALVLVTVGYSFMQSQRAPQTVTPKTHETYTSKKIGIQFQHPRIYTVTEGSSEYQGIEHRHLTLVETSAVIPENGEGPTAIAMVEIPETPTSTLEAWVRASQISNFQLSSDQKFTHITVGGEPALAYRHSGLYEFDAVAVAHNGKIYMLSASWMDANDKIRTDFKNLLSSVTFTQ